MNKTLLGLFSLASILCSQTSLADSDNGFFLGLGLDTSIQAETSNVYDDDTETKKNSFSSSSYALSGGYRTKSNNRIKLSYVKISADHKTSDLTYSGYDLDWQFVYGQSLVQPYWGIGFGSYGKDDSAKFNDGEDLKGFSFQLMTGAKFDINDHLELNASYHIRTIVWEAFEYYNGISDVSVTSIDSITSLQVGASFKF